MKHILLDLLSHTDPGKTTVNNCIALINREQAVRPDDGHSHEDLLVKAHRNALDTAQFLEAAANTARRTSIDHAELLGSVELVIQEIDREMTRYTPAYSGLAMAKDKLKTMLHKHETSRTLRALRDR